jgi:CheY-like chemotaxis protein
MSEAGDTDATMAPPGGTLLLVDDEANILAALRRLLRRDGYTLITAASGEEGLQKLAEHPVDVILSDQRMPGMSGVEFLRKARERRPETVRLVLSGYTELHSITRAINEGAIFKFLTKPWDDELLRASIAEAMHYKRLADDNRRLSVQLAEANRHLEHLLAEQRAQIARGQRAMGVLHEVLQLLPWPLLGVDQSGMLVAVNAAASALLDITGAALGGDLAHALPPTLAGQLAAMGEDELPADIDGIAYRVLCRELGAGSQASGRLFIFVREGDHDHR